MFNKRDYDGETCEGNAFDEEERREIAQEEDAQREEIALAISDARYANFIAGRCSGDAADEGGERYEGEMKAWASAEIAEPVAKSVNGWLRAMGAPEFATIMPGIAVKVGKRRAA